MENHESQRTSYTILIVDDEWQNIETLSAMLHDGEYNILSADNGKTCLEVLEKEKVDLVLLDISMPEMDGFDTLSRIRVHKKTKDLPVIFLTGHMRTSVHMERGFNLGVNEYLVKPIEANELLVRVKSILRMTAAEKKVRQLQMDFFSMLVHDLRGPLGAISAFTHLMLEDNTLSSSDTTEMLAMTESSCEHMLNLINDILDLSKLESEYVSLSKQEVDLVAAIENSLARMKPLALTKAIALKRDFSSPTVRVNADAQKIEQVMDNLLNNAIKFTDEGGTITIAVILSPQVKALFSSQNIDSSSLVVAVRDTGVGISPKNIPYVFDKYRQITTEHLPVAKGTGLGLAICKNIVEAHGGRIWVESSEGRGSSFYFSLPV
ncbi:MAG: hybrid sensor histidine kinase/response regulator [Bacteroidota bacterium]|nr:hybrid sensor histidine kinase/response regulator [Bacteroidota bacterium]